MGLQVSGICVPHRAKLHGTGSVLSHGLGSTVLSYPSFEKPALAKPSQESMAELWGREARKEKRSHGIAVV